MNEQQSKPRETKRWLQLSPVVWAAVFQGAVAVTMAPTAFLSIVLLVVLGKFHLICLLIAHSLQIDDWNIAWAIVWLTSPVTYFASIVLNLVYE